MSALTATVENFHSLIAADEQEMIAYVQHHAALLNDGVPPSFLRARLDELEGIHDCRNLLVREAIVGTGDSAISVEQLRRATLAAKSMERAFALAGRRHHADGAERVRVVCYKLLEAALSDADDA